MGPSLLLCAAPGGADAAGLGHGEQHGVVSYPRAGQKQRRARSG